MTHERYDYKNVRKTAAFVVAFFALWTSAWMLHEFLALSESNNLNLLYWALAKIVVWMGFPYLYVNGIVRPVSAVGFIGLHQAYRGLAAGAIAAIVWVGVAFSVDGRPALHFVPTLTLLWVITGTPIAEEFTFRGVVLPGLHNGGLGFWKANLVTSILFLLVHCVGWWFQGALRTNLNPQLVGAIVLVSLAAGWLRHKTDSLYSGIVLHAVNNLYASLR